MLANKSVTYVTKLYRIRLIPFLCNLCDSVFQNFEALRTHWRKKPYLIFETQSQERTREKTHFLEVQFVLYSHLWKRAKKIQDIHGDAANPIL